ncbi:MAG TPA: fused MFS/spermidine synthase [Polyangia bacterium]|nr:fused MFS/spermidine synthase [Polyangia bacterium]
MGQLRLFAAGAFVSAALLFLLEPVVAKGLLPVLGGGAVVWTTAAAFFQVALVGGYLYGQLLARPGRWRAAVHLGLLAVAGVAFPLRGPLDWSAPARHQAVWLFGQLARTAGPPFVLLAATAPLIQSWFASPRQEQREPYLLYAASNAGSLAALLAYPVILEPWTGLALQRRLWTWGYALDVALLAACAWSSRARQASSWPSQPAPASPAPGWRRRAWWGLLAAVPSSLLLAVTSYMTTDLVALPLLWVMPLGLYLLTFVFAFGGRARVGMARLLWIQALLAVPVAAEMAVTRHGSAQLLIPVHAALFFVSALVCHRRLADSRPPPAHAATFYVCIAVGGAAGALFNVFLAPALFHSLAEYPLGLIAAVLLRPAIEPPRQAWSRRLDLALPAAVAAALLVSFAALQRIWAGPRAQLLGLGVVLAAAGAAVYAFRFRPLRFGLGVAAIIGCGALYGVGSDPVVTSRRSFYAVHRVTREGAILKLASGNTLHGAQDTAAGRSREPLTYYHRASPIGDVMSAWAGRPQLRDVAVVGLGAGALAAYAAPGSRWTFFEIDPAVVQLAGDSGPFTYLRDARARLDGAVDVVLGDGRLSLAAQPDGRFGLIVLDAFSSDAIPVHLLTREALALDARKLAPGGLLAIHLSNRYLVLDSVVGAAASAAGLTGLERSADVTPEQGSEGKSGSIWAVLARSAVDLAPLRARLGWRSLPAAAKAWTDDASSLWPVLHLGAGF